MVDLIPQVGGGLLGALIGWAAARLKDAPGLAKRRVQQVDDLTEDLRRWVRDRDRALHARFAEIVAQNNAAGTYFSGALVQGLKVAKEQALHEWRDEGSRKLRRFDELSADETMVQWFLRWRRLRKLDRPDGFGLCLPLDCLEKLDQWRAPAKHPTHGSAPELSVEDVSRRELEPRLAEVERPCPG